MCTAWVVCWYSSLLPLSQETEKKNAHTQSCISNDELPSSLTHDALTLYCDVYHCLFAISIETCSVFFTLVGFYIDRFSFRITFLPTSELIFQIRMPQMCNKFWLFHLSYFPFGWFRDKNVYVIFQIETCFWLPLFRFFTEKKKTIRKIWWCEPFKFKTRVWIQWISLYLVCSRRRWLSV